MNPAWISTSAIANAQGGVRKLVYCMCFFRPSIRALRAIGLPVLSWMTVSAAFSEHSQLFYPTRHLPERPLPGHIRAVIKKKLNTLIGDGCRAVGRHLASAPHHVFGAPFRPDRFLVFMPFPRYSRKGCLSPPGFAVLFSGSTICLCSIFFRRQRRLRALP